MFAQILARTAQCACSAQGLSLPDRFLLCMFFYFSSIEFSGFDPLGLMFSILQASAVVELTSLRAPQTSCTQELGRPQLGASSEMQFSCQEGRALRRDHSLAGYGQFNDSAWTSATEPSRGSAFSDSKAMSASAPQNRLLVPADFASTLMLRRSSTSPRPLIVRSRR